MIKPQGFGGWLLLIAISQWLGILGILVELLFELAGYVSQSNLPMRRGIIGEAGLDIALLAFMFYTTALMTMKCREFPTLFRIQPALFVLIPLLSTWCVSTLAGKPIEGLDFAATAVKAVVGVIGASIFILYSLRSERVRNTFIH